jgi:hypothetical protein
MSDKDILDKSLELGEAVARKQLVAFTEFLKEHHVALSAIPHGGIRQITDFTLCAQMLGALYQRQPFMTVDAQVCEKLSRATQWAKKTVEQYSEITDPGTQARDIVVVQEAEEFAKTLESLGQEKENVQVIRDAAPEQATENKGLDEKTLDALLQGRPRTEA